MPEIKNQDQNVPTQLKSKTSSLTIFWKTLQVCGGQIRKSEADDLFPRNGRGVQFHGPVEPKEIHKIADGASIEPGYVEICFVAGTLISTGDGLRKIEEINKLRKNELEIINIMLIPLNNWYEKFKNASPYIL